MENRGDERGTSFAHGKAAMASPSYATWRSRRRSRPKLAKPNSTPTGYLIQTPAHANRALLASSPFPASPHPHSPAFRDDQHTGYPLRPNLDIGRAISHCYRSAWAFWREKDDSMMWLDSPSDIQSVKVHFPNTRMSDTLYQRRSKDGPIQANKLTDKHKRVASIFLNFNQSSRRPDIQFSQLFKSVSQPVLSYAYDLEHRCWAVFLSIFNINMRPYILILNRQLILIFYWTLNIKPSLHTKSKHVIKLDPCIAVHRPSSPCLSLPLFPPLHVLYLFPTYYLYYYL